MKTYKYITSAKRKSEMKKLESKLVKFENILLIYRGIKEVPKNKTWLGICKEYELLLKSVVRYNDLKGCAHI